MNPGIRKSAGRPSGRSPKRTDGLRPSGTNIGPEAPIAGTEKERIAMNKKPVALVTGAGRGIGRGIALELAAEGFDIAGCDIVYEPKNAKSGLFEVKKAVDRIPDAAFHPDPGRRVRSRRTGANPRRGL